MSAHQFFLDDQVISTIQEQPFTLQLNKGDAHHAKVVRLKEGEIIAVVDAVKDYYLLEVVGFEGNLPVCCISQKPYVASPGSETAPVVLVQGLAKGDAMDEVIRSATEVGIQAFLPLACERSVAKLEPKKVEKRLERWATISRNAAMQAGLREMVDFKEPMGVEEFAASLGEDSVLFVFWEEAEPERTLIAFGEANAEAIRKAKEVYVLVGPEGGLERFEVEALRTSKALVGVLTLGSTVLRSATAGVVAPALVKYEMQRLLAK